MKFTKTIRTLIVAIIGIAFALFALACNTGTNVVRELDGNGNVIRTYQVRGFIEYDREDGEIEFYHNGREIEIEDGRYTIEFVPDND